MKVVNQALVAPFSPQRIMTSPAIKSTPSRGREVFGFGANIAASEGGEEASPSKAVKDDRVSQIGATRLQQAAVCTFVQAQLGSSTSDEDESSNVLTRRRTIAQVGKSEQRGKHAAHAGIICNMGDSVKSHIIGRIVHMGLQEDDEAILRAKGANDEEIDSLKGHRITKDKVDATVRNFWQRGSLLGGSHTELGALNTCYQVDRVINLCVDKRIESEFRPKIIEWTRDVVAGRVDELSMMKMYATELNAFLAHSEIEAKGRLDSLVSYQSLKGKAISHITDILGAGKVSKANLAKLLSSVEAWRDAKLQLQTKLQGAARVSLPSFGYFQHLLQLPQRISDKKAADKSESELSEYTWELLCKYQDKGLFVGEEELSKFERQKSKLESMVRGFNLEREGTVFSDEDYLMMFGKFDEVSKTRVLLSDSEKKNFALDLIRSPRKIAI